MAILKLKNINKTYYDTVKPDNILHSINLTFHLGEFVSILGESGVGKSTLMNIIGGLDNQYTGKVIFNHHALHHFTPKQLDQYRRRDIGFIFQSFHLIKNLTVIGNIRVALDMLKMPKSKKNARIKELLKEVGLTSQGHKYPNQLSGGQQQRVSIARALASNPKVLIADEPTGALDQTNTNDVLRILNKIAQQGKLVLTVTHSIKVAKHGTRIVKIIDGTVKQDEQIRKPTKKHSQVTHYQSHPLKSGSLWRMAFDNFKRHKLQNTLIAIGGAIGLFSILALFGLGTGVKSYVAHQITSQINPHVMLVQRHNQSSTKSFTRQDQNRIKRIKNVKYADKGIATQGVKYQLDNKKGKVDQLSTSAQFIKSSNIKYGNYPTKNKVMISQQVAKHLNAKHEKSLLGKKLSVKTVIPQDVKSENSMTDSMVQHPKVSSMTFKIAGITKGKSGGLTITYPTMQKMASKNHQKLHPQYLTVGLTGNIKHVNQAQSKIGKITQHGKKSYKVLGATGSLLKLINKYVSIIILILTAIAGIALLVTAVLMVAILLISVTERKREIGILRALGASKANVRHLFIFQAILMSLASSICATIIGIVGEIGVNYFTNIKFSYDFMQISIINVLVIFIISLIIYILASVIPAWHASRLDPIVCLNS